MLYQALFEKLGCDFHDDLINRIRHPLLRARVFRAVIVFAGDVGVAAVVVPDVYPFLAEVRV